MRPGSGARHDPAADLPEPRAESLMDAATATRMADQPAAASRFATPGEPRRVPPLDERRAASSLLDLVQSLLHEVPGLISDRVELLALELSRAGAALGKIVALTVAVAILGITAWAGFWAGVVMGLLALDWHWAVALGIVIIANAGALAWALLQMRRLGGLLKLPATRRHLTMRASAQAVAAKSLPVGGEAGEHGANDSLKESEHHASPAAAVPH
jgi:hypothetical protein